MTTISAKHILSSRNATKPDTVVTTLLLRYRRCIHSEFLTHRVFTKNAASSRAIPIKKMIESIRQDPFIPLHWGKNQKGMQAAVECNELVQIGWNDTNVPGTDGPVHGKREDAWLQAMEDAIKWAERFDKAGYHKQLANRLLEPFAHITVLVSSTQWSNFLGVRDHGDAEPHMQLLAKAVAKAFENADVRTLGPGTWHLPFLTKDEEDFLELTDKIKLSVARCASTSYKTVEGFDMTMERATAIYVGLVSGVPLHASPAEHGCFADERIAGAKGPYGEWRVEHWARPDLHGNFDGFCQHRKQLANECL
jgi:hypothetical protein